MFQSVKFKRYRFFKSLKYSALIFIGCDEWIKPKRITVCYSLSYSLKNYENAATSSMPNEIVNKSFIIRIKTVLTLI